MAPLAMHVVPPGEGLERESYEVAKFAAYARLVRGRLGEALGGEATYPEPVEHCLLCGFWQECRERRVADDHLSLVAGATRRQRAELEGSLGIGTLEALGAEPLPEGWAPGRGARESYERVQDQARVQLTGRRREDAGYHELLPREPGLGLARLPEPDAADVFFDFEGDPFVGIAGARIGGVGIGGAGIAGVDAGGVGPGGLEYLWGWVAAPGGRRGTCEARGAGLRAPLGDDGGGGARGVRNVRRSDDRAPRGAPGLPHLPLRALRDVDVEAVGGAVRDARGGARSAAARRGVRRPAPGGRRRPCGRRSRVTR